MELAFETLWQAYGALLTKYPEKKPCDGPWENQCAIRMSMILETGGISFKHYSEPRCKHGHARGAESLANWLWQNHLGKPKVYPDPVSGKDKLKNLEGILFFKNCFTRNGQTVRSGDHIDLWKKGVVKTYNDPDNLAQQLWFWKLN